MTAEHKIHLKRILSPLLRYGLGIGILIYFFEKNDIDWSKLKGLLEPETFLLLLAIKAMFYLLASWRWQRILRELEIRATLRQAYSFSCLAVFFNYFLPGNTSSDVAKTFFAARVFGSPGRVVFAIVLDRLIGLFSLLLVLAVGLVIFARSGSPQFRAVWALVAGAPWLYVFAIGVVTLSAMAVVFSFVRRHPKMKEFTSVVAKLKSPAFWSSIIAISFASHFLFAIFLAVAAHYLNLSMVDLAGCLLIFPLATLAMIIPITPGSLGVGQVIYQYLFDIYTGVPTEASHLFTVVQVMDLAFVIGGALYFARLLKLKKTDSVDKNPDRNSG